MPAASTRALSGREASISFKAVTTPHGASSAAALYLIDDARPAMTPAQSKGTIGRGEIHAAARTRTVTATSRVSGTSSTPKCESRTCR